MEIYLDQPSYLAAADGTRLAYRLAPGAAPTVVFLPGFNSDMRGSKAEHLATWCAARRQAYLRLDYSGHGQSGGAFTDGTIGRWRDDALAVIDTATNGPLVLVGSSMGGWIALLLALARPHRVAGLVGIAAAPDFTETLMWAAMAPAERDAVMRDGVLLVPSEYGAPLHITRRLIEDGRRHTLLDRPIPITVPVRLIQGQHDPDVPWEHALRLARQIASTDVQLTLIKDGEHRLSRPSDLAVLNNALAGLLDGVTLGR